MKVTEFATNLRDGVTELPLDDKSIELSSKIRDMQIQRDTDKLTMERLEREIAGLDGNYSGGASAQPELFAMKEMLEQLKEDNKALRDGVTRATDQQSFYNNKTASSMTPGVRRHVEEIIQEPIAEMPAEAQAQFAKLAEGHTNMTDEIAALKREVKQVRYQVILWAAVPTKSNTRLLNPNSTGQDCPCSLLRGRRSSLPGGRQDHQPRPSPKPTANAG